MSKQFLIIVAILCLLIVSSLYTYLCFHDYPEKNSCQQQQNTENVKAKVRNIDIIKKEINFISTHKKDSFLYEREFFVQSWIDKNLSDESKKKHKDFHLRMWHDPYCSQEEIRIVNNIYEEVLASKEENLWKKMFMYMFYVRQRGCETKAEALMIDVLSKVKAIGNSEKNKLLKYLIVFKFGECVESNAFPIDKTAVYSSATKDSLCFADKCFIRGHYKKALEAGLEHPLVYIKLAKLSEYHEKLDEMLMYYDKALALNPNYGNVWSDKAEYYYKQGQLEEALHNAINAVDCWDNYWLGMIMKGRCLNSFGRGKEAVLVLDKFIKQNPGFSWAVEIRGNAKNISKDFIGAIKDFEESYFSQKKDHIIHRIGMIYNRIGEYDKAIYVFSKLEGMWGHHGRMISNIISNNKNKLKELFLLTRNKIIDEKFVEGALLSIHYADMSFDYERFKTKKHSFLFQLYQGAIKEEEALDKLKTLKKKEQKEILPKIYFYTALRNIKNNNEIEAEKKLKKVMRLSENPSSHIVSLAIYELKKIRSKLDRKDLFEL